MCQIHIRASTCSRHSVQCADVRVYAPSKLAHLLLHALIQSLLSPHHTRFYVLLLASCLASHLPGEMGWRWEWDEEESGKQ